MIRRTSRPAHRRPLDQSVSRIALAAICALGATVASNAAAQAASPSVYPGCAVPAAPNHIFYVDPVKGSASGDGSAAHPWNSLHNVFQSPIGVSPLLSSVPYYHTNPTTRKLVWGVDPNAPIKPGDAIYLMSGNYGAVTIGDGEQPIENSAFVTLAAAPGQTPVFSSLDIYGVNKIYVQGVKIQSLATGYNKAINLVNVQGSMKSPTRDIVINDLNVSSKDDVSKWSVTDWKTNGNNGINVGSHDPSANPCISISNSLVQNIREGVNLLGNQVLFTNNRINNTGESQMMFAGNDISISHNTLTNMNYLNDGKHLDFMEGSLYIPSDWTGTEAGFNATHVDINNNIVIDSNLMIRQTSPTSVSFPWPTLGIGSTEEYTNMTISNNVIIQSGFNGIQFTSLINSSIVNNTILSDNNLPKTIDGEITADGPRATNWIAVYNDPNLTSRPRSSNVVIRNNIATGYIVDATAEKIFADHNICSRAYNPPAPLGPYNPAPTCSIGYMNAGKLVAGGSTPGKTYDFNPCAYQKLSANCPASQYIYDNFVDTVGAAQEFVDFDPAHYAYDVHLKAGAPAVGAGSATGAPALDISGAKRTAPFDIGAYAYQKPPA